MAGMHLYPPMWEVLGHAPEQVACGAVDKKRLAIPRAYLVIVAHTLGKRWNVRRDENTTILRESNWKHPRRYSADSIPSWFSFLKKSARPRRRKSSIM